MSKVLSVGVVGCGTISDAYFQLARGFANIKVVACADLVREVAESKAGRYGLAALSVEELVSSSSVDVVVNLTIPAAHYEVSKAALGAGKHVYSEKPLALTYDEARSLLATAAERGVTIGGATDTFLGGAGQAARRLLDGGAIGRVVTGTCQFFTHGVESWHPNPDFYYRPGGGPVFDMGPYYLSALINLLGPVRTVTAMSTKGVDERVIGNGKRLGERIAVELPTSFTSILDFHNGAQITFATSWDVWRDGHTNPIELYGVDGTMLLPDPNYFGGTLAWSSRDGEYATLDASSEPFGATNWPMEEPKVSNYRMLGVADMVNAIGSGRQPRCSGALAAHIIEVMEAIQTSAAERRFVTIGSTIGRPVALTAQDAARLRTGS